MAPQTWVLLPILEEHLLNILSRNKFYEYRFDVQIKKKDCKRAILYFGNRVKMLVGEFDIVYSICGQRDYVWRKTKDGAGTNRKGFNELFKDRPEKCKCCAMRIGEVRLYNKPFNLSKINLEQLSKPRYRSSESGVAPAKPDTSLT